MKGDLHFYMNDKRRGYTYKSDFQFYRNRPTYYSKTLFFDYTIQFINIFEILHDFTRQTSIKLHAIKEKI